MFDPRFMLEEAVMVQIDLLQYLPPLKCKPHQWTSNYCGRLYEEKSIILGAGNHHDSAQAYDALNKLQKIPWILDEYVLMDETDTNKEMDKFRFNSFNTVKTDMLLHKLFDLFKVYPVFRADD